MSASVRRMMMVRTLDEPMAAKAPKPAPTKAPSTTDPTPTASAGTAAAMHRDKTSRPNWSHPKGCSRLGSAKRAVRSMAEMS